MTAENEQPQTDVTTMIDRLVKQAHEALAQMADFSQDKES